MILAEHAVDESHQEQWSGCQTEKCVYHSHAIIYLSYFLQDWGANTQPSARAMLSKLPAALFFLPSTGL
jgi:hypothetical protein